MCQMEKRGDRLCDEQNANHAKTTVESVFKASKLQHFIHHPFIDSFQLEYPSLGIHQLQN